MRRQGLQVSWRAQRLEKAKAKAFEADAKKGFTCPKTQKVRGPESAVVSLHP
jgi:hypothetical protein